MRESGGVGKGGALWLVAGAGGVGECRARGVVDAGEGELRGQKRYGAVVRRSEKRGAPSRDRGGSALAARAD
jgi:hypothetical protein